MAKVFKVYQDASHSWMGVKLKEVQELGLVDQISQHSYQKGQTVYLEEDKDLPLFKMAYEAKYGLILAKVIDQGKRSTVRNYLHYSPVVVETSYPTGATAADSKQSVNPGAKVLNGFLKANLNGGNAEEGVTLNLPENPVNLKSDF